MRKAKPPAGRHILIISQYFYPESFRINDMAKEWVKRGYRVTVLTGIPNYPQGVFFDGYGYRRRRREWWNGVEVIRIPILPRGSSPAGLAANYASFVLAGFFWNLAGGIKADLVFTIEVSPMTQALVGCWYSKKHRVPHLLYVQDLWPETVESVAGIQNRAVLWLIGKIVDYIYKNADRIFATSPSFVDAVVNRNVPVPKRKVHYWPQYAEDFYQPFTEADVRRCAAKSSPVHKIPSSAYFRIAFTGNIGAAQGLSILPEAARLLKNKAVRFILIGSGRCQRQLEADIKRRGVEEMFILIPRQPAEVVPKLLACCDAAFLSFMDNALFEKTIPAKLQSYLACGMPVIAAAKGEAQRVVREAACGICVDIGDSRALAQGIQGLMDAGRGTVLETMQNNSRKYYKGHFRKGQLMDEMDGYIASALSRKNYKTRYRKRPVK